MIPKLRFTIEEAQAAFDEWRFNCGPTSLAVMLQMRPEELRPFMGDFEEKGYTNPNLMESVLKGLCPDAVQFPVVTSHDIANHGLTRVEWVGPWTSSDLPPEKNRHSHWVASATDDCGVLHIFDCNAFKCGWGLSFWWKDTVVPHILETCEPEATGGWYTTHIWEIPVLQRRL